MCPRCRHADDDHGAAGCLVCTESFGPCGATGATNDPGPTICVAVRFGVRPWRQVEMPAATTARYAAKRIAEAFGLDPDATEYVIFDPATAKVIDQDEVMAGWNGMAVVVAVMIE